MGLVPRPVQPTQRDADRALEGGVGGFLLGSTRGKCILVGFGAPKLAGDDRAGGTTTTACTLTIAPAVSRFDGGDQAFLGFEADARRVDDAGRGGWGGVGRLLLLLLLLLLCVMCECVFVSEGGRRQRGGLTHFALPHLTRRRVHSPRSRRSPRGRRLCAAHGVCCQSDGMASPHRVFAKATTKNLA